MLDLTKLQKEELGLLQDTEGFRIMKLMVADMEKDLFTPFKTENVRDKAVQDDLINTQMMLSWAEYLINEIEATSLKITDKSI